MVDDDECYESRGNPTYPLHRERETRCELQAISHLLNDPGLICGPYIYGGRISGRAKHIPSPREAYIQGRWLVFDIWGQGCEKRPFKWLTGSFEDAAIERKSSLLVLRLWWSGIRASLHPPARVALGRAPGGGMLYRSRLVSSVRDHGDRGRRQRAETSEWHGVWTPDRE